MPLIQNILTIDEEKIKQHYDCIFCDVWGVLHNGVKAFTQAIEALKRIKEAGKTIILITNSPRLSAEVKQELQCFSIEKTKHYDAIITSGDATKHIIDNAPEKIFYIGSHDLSTILDQKKHKSVSIDEAEAILCTGLFDAEEQDLSSYNPLLKKLKAKDLPFICANPDIVVERGDKFLWCAGALARAYENISGKVLIAGKPHLPIYKRAYALAKDFKENLEKNRILAIGDGILTDIKGAENFSIDCIFITSGIHHKAYYKAGIFEENLLHKFFEKHKLFPQFYMHNLQ